METPAIAQKTEVTLGPVLDFMRLLWALDHRLQSASKFMESTLGVTGPQRMVIRLVGQFPNITAGEIAALLHVHPSTLSGVVKRLEKSRTIARKTDPSDARRARFVLTPRGQTINKRTSGTVEGAVRRVLAELSSDKADAAREVLVLLSREVEQLSERVE